MANTNGCSTHGRTTNGSNSYNANGNIILYSNINQATLALSSFNLHSVMELANDNIIKRIGVIVSKLFVTMCDD